MIRLLNYQSCQAIKKEEFWKIINCILKCCYDSSSSGQKMKSERWNQKTIILTFKSIKWFQSLLSAFSKKNEEVSNISHICVNSENNCDYIRISIDGIKLYGGPSTIKIEAWCMKTHYCKPQNHMLLFTEN